MAAESGTGQATQLSKLQDLYKRHLYLDAFAMAFASSQGMALASKAFPACAKAWLVTSGRRCVLDDEIVCLRL